MEKISLAGFEEIIGRDSDLTARAKEIIGEGDGLRSRIAEFASSLGYEIDFDLEPAELDDDELDDVAGGLPEIKDSCDHNYVFYKSVRGRFWGKSEMYKCTKCGDIIFNKTW